MNTDCVLILSVVICMPKNKSINLLPQEEFESSLAGRTLRWAMGTFRMIVIITEIVVMGAFLSRFWLDAKNSDLANSIKIKSAQIAAQAEVEKQFRSVQAKLDIAKEILKSNSLSQKIGLITSKLPNGLTLTGLSILDGSIQIKGNSQSEVEIMQFMTNLKADKSLKSVDLGQISSSETSGLSTVFTIKINY